MLPWQSVSLPSACSLKVGYTQKPLLVLTSPGASFSTTFFWPLVLSLPPRPNLDGEHISSCFSGSCASMSHNYLKTIVPQQKLIIFLQVLQTCSLPSLSLGSEYCSYPGLHTGASSPLSLVFPPHLVINQVSLMMSRSFCCFFFWGGSFQCPFPWIPEPFLLVTMLLPRCPASVQVCSCCQHLRSNLIS